MKEAVAHVAAADPAMAALIERVGPCTWAARRFAGGHFGALARSILYQQLAGKAAAAIHARFLALFERGRPTPEAVLALPEETLRSAGLSAAKAASIRDLAAKVLDGTVRLDGIGRRSDDEIVERLSQVRGIGRWTAEMFLMFQLGRPDVWPVGDYGVRKGWAIVHGRPDALPTPSEAGGGGGGVPAAPVGGRLVLLAGGRNGATPGVLSAEHCNYCGVLHPKSGWGEFRPQRWGGRPVGVIGRIVIDDVRPRTPDGFPAKAVVGEAVRISADVFKDGHDVLAGQVRWRAKAKGNGKWATAPLHDLGNDRWEAVVEPTTLGPHEFVVEAWTDRYATWQRKVAAKRAAGQDVEVDLQEGELLDPEAGAEQADDLTTSEPFPLWVDRERALLGAWYELFPRSYGGFAGVRDHLPYVAGMGFDVLYLPPVHPIGRSFRKGPNNSLTSTPDDPGSPWAIGSEEGGHTAIHPDLGTFTDFEDLVTRAHELGMEVALDYALQCSPDHPWVREHPEWFHHRPDGTIAYAENPPKKYQDIYPINFWPPSDDDRRALWDACKEIVDFWIGKGIRIFRVDNPHTKPTAFWAWMIPEVQKQHPGVVFLAEAFTRPKVMAKLAEVGFSQSYTYFTWRTAKWELEEYLEEISHGPKADFMRPNFWPNTPDILSGPLRDGPPAAFRQRFVLAATMVPSYGIYSGYELCENEPMSDANEEYLHSEKYEIKRRDFDDPHSLAPFIARVNDIRRRHPALQRLRNVRFHRSTNDAVIAYSKHTDDRSDVVLIVVNLDPWNTQECVLGLDLGFLGLPWDMPYEAFDELSGQSFRWQGAEPYVRLDPHQAAHVLALRAAR